MANRNTTRKQAPKAHGRRWGRWILLILLLIFLNIGIGVSIYTYRIWQTLPPVHELKEWRPD